MDLKRPEHDNSSLNALQSWMQQQLLFPRNDEQVDEVICSTSKLSAQRHLEIYQRSYIARLRDCMFRQFPALAYALSSELFQHFTDVFLSTYPSKSYTLADLGRDFALFLQETRPDAQATEKESWPDFMIELATFEYEINIAFDQQEPDDKRSFSDGKQQLILNPVLHLFHHKFPIAPYYKSFLGNQQPQLPFEKETYAVLVRRNYTLGLFELKPAQYVFLKQLKATHNLEEAKTHTQTRFSFIDTLMEELWQQWKDKWLEEGFMELQ